MKKIITSGYPYTDIDVLACALSYEQLLKLEGYDALAVLTGPINLSINRSLKQAVKYESELKYPIDMCEFIIVDLSLPEFYSKFVKEDKVIEIFDHRFFNPNLNKLKQELKDKCHIEQVGSCSTLIYEEFKKRGYTKKLTDLNALLIYTAIVSNTLDLKADVTNKRDIEALNEISKDYDIKDEAKIKYYEEVEQEILKDPNYYLSIDTKKVDINGVFCTIPQIELYNSKRFFKEHGNIINEYLVNANNPLGFVTSPSISEGVNYIYALNVDTQKILLKLWPYLKFKNNIARTDKLYLRKEILSKLLSL